MPRVLREHVNDDEFWRGAEWVTVEKATRTYLSRPAAIPLRVYYQNSQKYKWPACGCPGTLQAQGLLPVLWRQNLQRRGISSRNQIKDVNVFSVTLVL